MIPNFTIKNRSFHHIRHDMLVFHMIFTTLVMACSAKVPSSRHELAHVGPDVDSFWVLVGSCSAPSILHEWDTAVLLQENWEKVNCWYVFSSIVKPTSCCQYVLTVS